MHFSSVVMPLCFWSIWMYSTAGILGEAFWSTGNAAGAQRVSIFYFELDSCYLQLISHSFFYCLETANNWSAYLLCAADDFIDSVVCHCCRLCFQAEEPWPDQLFLTVYLFKPCFLLKYIFHLWCVPSKWRSRLHPGFKAQASYSFVWFFNSISFQIIP